MVLDPRAIAHARDPEIENPRIAQAREHPPQAVGELRSFSAAPRVEYQRLESATLAREWLMQMGAAAAP